MGYDFDIWRKRHIERSDLTTELVHLTRSVNSKSAIDVLYEILQTGKVNGSITSSGFIVGNTPAVCLQDAPLNAVGQNCWFEQTYRKVNSAATKRYDPTGLIFSKTYIYSKGGRPVIYDRTSDAKGYLPKDQLWRIVNFDLSDKNNIVDWTHEREWRIPNELEFEPTDVVLLFANNSDLRSFIDLCDKSGNQYYRLVRGMSTMESILN
jgi:hypothetical protein